MNCLRKSVRTSVILTPAREGGRFRTAVLGPEGQQNRESLAPARPIFWLEFETPIEVERLEA